MSSIFNKVNRTRICCGGAMLVGRHLMIQLWYVQDPTNIQDQLGRTCQRGFIQPSEFCVPIDGTRNEITVETARIHAVQSCIISRKPLDRLTGHWPKQPS